MLEHFLFFVNFNFSFVS